MSAAAPLLDDLSRFRQSDPEGMLDHIHRVPSLCRQAWEVALSSPLPAGYAEAKNVVVLGMGGSAIGGDLAASLVAEDCKVPIQVIREYEAPAFVGPETLVIASSYSGSTEETLSAARQAIDRGARLLAFSTGGPLASLAQQTGAPVWPIDYVAQPRATLPFGFLYILGALQRLGFIADRASQFAEMLNVLEILGSQINEQVPEARNPAKQLAHQLQGRMAVFYGGGMFSVVARRWKGQLNENAKSWAFFEVFPELDHNAVVGYQFPSELADRIFVVLLSGSSLLPRVRLRYEVTAELLDQFKIPHQTVEAQGSSPLGQMLSQVLFGDYVSYYLAILNGADPTTIEPINFLKARLAARQ